MSMWKQQGFSLIELVISLAIIAILAGMAVVSFMELTSKARVAEGLALSAPVKQAVSEYHNLTQRLPASNSMAELPLGEQISSKAVKSIGIDATPTSGTVVITFNGIGSIAEGDTLLLTPVTGSTSLRWRCHSMTLINTVLPANCR